jgi:hypothetical protein
MMTAARRQLRAAMRVRPANRVTRRGRGEIPRALGQVAADLLAADPDIGTVDLIAAK